MHIIDHTYDLNLVALSVAIAVVASYIALDLGRRAIVTGSWSGVWLAGSALAMGLGIWAMHFTGMLAFQIPIPTTYDWVWTIASMMIAVAAAGVAFWLGSRRTPRHWPVLTGGMVLGSGIVGMHFVGMAAMQVDAVIQYEPRWISASLVVAVAASLAALLLTFRLQPVAHTGVQAALHGSSALIMGSAISMMHYSGMAAAHFSGVHASLAQPVPGWDASVLGTATSLAFLGIVVLALVAVQVDHHFARRSLVAQQRLAQERDMLRTLLDTIPDAIWHTDAHGRFLRVNRAFARRRGLQREDDAIGKMDAELPGRIGDPTVMEAFASAAALHDHHTCIEQPNGATRWLATTIVPLTDRLGRTTGIVGIARDITAHQQVEQDLRATNARLELQLWETAQLQAQLREQAVRDGMTGVFNRRYFEETLPRELAAAQRDEQPLALVLVDIDHFKRINDTYGHAAGDEVIKALAQLLLTTTRAGDVVARYGGEEFVLVLPDATWECALCRAEMWREAFARTPILCDATEIHATMSLGVVAWPVHGTTAETLLRIADQALYAAKAAGRNRVGMLSPPASAPAL